jgi:5'-3' exonuclease
MKILIDGTNILHINFLRKEFQEDQDWNKWRSDVFSAIYRLISRPQIEQVVLAIDSSPTWRKIFYPKYKAHRLEKKKKSDINWYGFYNESEKFINEIKEYLPLFVLQIARCEADDIVSVIANNSTENCLVVSTDSDYVQLIKKNVKVYNPIKNKYLKEDNDFIINNCLLGQKKDNIPNILTPLDNAPDKRATGFGPAKLLQVKKHGIERWLKDNKLEKRFLQNRVLIDFNYIPNTISNMILEEYKNYELPEQRKILEFLNNNQSLSIKYDPYEIEKNLSRLYE